MPICPSRTHTFFFLLLLTHTHKNTHTHNQVTVFMRDVEAGAPGFTEAWTEWLGAHEARPYDVAVGGR